MSETAILTAARAAVAASLPNAKDWTDDPSDPRPDKLDAFVLTLNRTGSEPASMGSDLEDVTMDLEVEIFTTFTPSEEGTAKASALGRTARAAIMADSVISALCYRVQGGAFTVEIGQSEIRLARVNATTALSAEF